MPQERAIATDYLVVGCGQSGMGFADSLLDVSDADIVMVDRRTTPGGHWVDAYPFVRLHMPSQSYGMSSTPLGTGRVQTHGPEAGLYERASGSEIIGHFDSV
ncbi:MAG TPA: pyridine nucleotide-disulfide oxidoreductase, partial [Nocardioidaceae bacterium]|nr:pyridine nucleotide-disulfide oxidoreductase [Nocardioidaceae bacterium]